MSVQIPRFKNPAEFLKYLKEQDVQFVDLNLTDLRGQWHRTTLHAGSLNSDRLEQGVFFDASSVAGWAPVHDSDMILKPDLGRVAADPFAAQKTLKVFCDVFDAKTAKPYACDPRSIARAAEKYLKAGGIADTAFFGAEAEFFVFDSVQVDIESHHAGFRVDSEEGAYNSGRIYPTGNMGHRPGPAGGGFSEAPVDSLSDIRGEMLTVLGGMGVAAGEHRHGAASGQCALSLQYSALTDSADNLQLFKHVVHNVAHSYGKTATFMPKPLSRENGSGLHIHQSLWKGGKPLFAGNGYADLSETALYYLGGLLRHARALSAFTNPATNSYKRLVSGLEAPALLAYSARSRSVACRIPRGASPKGRRVEARFPDPSANPYLAFAALTMAGLDGIENRIHPGEAVDRNPYDSSEPERAPVSCRSLREAMDALRSGHDFLLKGGVFSKEAIDAYLSLKEEECRIYEESIHPAEYRMYYSS